MKNRVLAIDIFRGMTIALMIIVNTPGTWEHVFDPLEHASWHGCTPTDLVFPSFLFIIGASAWFSFKKFDHVLNRASFLKTLKRTAIIFFLGLFLFNIPGLVISFFDFSTGSYLADMFQHLRIPGVLQRLALCYGIGSLLVLKFNKTTLIAISGFLLLFFWWAAFTFGQAADPYGLQTNAVLYLDTWLLGADHLYHGETVNGQPFAFDPEGILSTIPAIVTYVLGYLTGQYIDSNKDKRFIISELFPASLLLIAAGFLWEYWLGFPVNKKLWTSSYVLYAGGISMLMLTISIWLADIKGWGKRLDFFRIFGTNPLLAYVLSELLIIILVNIRYSGADGAVHNAYEGIYNSLFVPLAGNNEWGSLLFALSYMLFNWLVIYIFYKRGIFWKI